MLLCMTTLFCLQLSIILSGFRPQSQRQRVPSSQLNVRQPDVACHLAPAAFILLSIKCSIAKRFLHCGAIALGRGVPQEQLEVRIANERQQTETTDAAVYDYCILLVFVYALVWPPPRNATTIIG